ncbi:unnamed protein product (macronuclear) [Paramecium tetraurelia]|uniref:Uncharacterized protein n=1 Tax=Paramecium tetraurelia TaxID=5888 RepID=A0C338_PARTE|nr:uncharacterized protein GSPATT00034683001 [Paramecium tetraurelia]CAK65205.1 unnamed protein product [Paramecium tetraurelia]|eukprot:XP_001432602.1 hypothetical protein (macronuclear) [Paramecium tetraurelia strain d4-2]
MEQTFKEQLSNIEAQARKFEECKIAFTFQIHKNFTIGVSCKNQLQSLYLLNLGKFKNQS